MNPQLVAWTCNIETHECLYLDRHVLNAVIVLIVAIAAIGLGWLIDASIAANRQR